MMSLQTYNVNKCINVGYNNVDFSIVPVCSHCSHCSQNGKKSGTIKFWEQMGIQLKKILLPAIVKVLTTMGTMGTIDIKTLAEYAIRGTMLYIERLNVILHVYTRACA